MIGSTKVLGGIGARIKLQHHESFPSLDQTEEKNEPERLHISGKDFGS